MTSRSTKPKAQLDHRLSWSLATWLTPAVSMGVFGLMIVAAVSGLDSVLSTLVATVGSTVVCVVIGALLLARGGRRGRGVGLALVAGGLFSGLIGAWLMSR